MKLGKESGGSRLRRRKQKTVWVHFSAEEHAQLRAAAGLTGLSMSAFVIAKALVAARQTLEDFNVNRPSA